MTMPDNDDDLLPIDGTLYGPDYVIHPGGPSWMPRSLDYKPHAERAAMMENMELQRKVRRLERQNTALLTILSKVQGWFARKPKSQSVKGGYTSVGRVWWLDGESLLSSITLPVEGDEEPPTGPVEHPNREA
jgi:hypothetical protein